MVILVVSLVVVGAGTTYVVRTAIENANTPPDPLSLPDILAAGDPSYANPEIDAMKAQAAQKLKGDKLKEARDGEKPDLDPVKIAKKAPGGGGFNPADFPPGSSPDPGSNKALGRQMAAARGWGDSEWGCLERLWDRESHWNERAMNRYSGAYGIPQSLPGSKMASAGGDWQTNAATQIKWGLGYIAGRYKTPCGAWGHSQATGWY
ncbi:lytic transglycosylase domain-containing protein [Microtetraspora malaysiensis]|uniref:aggregation-promoting factor C-terminal-like domain-containing protein n=1 Tax=Microtetraspora malaysiensis TaxID=161358 RepID=UPI003D8E4988